MKFTICCTNKGCYKLQEPYLDLSTNKVYCTLCEEEIANVSAIIKNQMKLNKQTQKPKTQSTFSVKCQHCSANDSPNLINNKLYCKSCNKELTNITEIFKNMLINKMKGAKKEDE